MYVDWKNFVKLYTPSEEYIADNSNSKILNSFIFFIILGFITALGLIARVDGKSDNDSPNKNIDLKVQKIKAEIDSIDNGNAMIESEIFILNHNIAQMFEHKEKQAILKLSKLIGTNKAIGAGIIIKLDDSDKPVGLYENPNIGLVHNTDLLKLINNLWESNAEAISLNNQRITATTGISCVGSTILVNKTRIAPPFIIKAVGNPEKMIKSIRNGYVQTLEVSGIKYSIEKYNKLEIPGDGTIILAGDF